MKLSSLQILFLVGFLIGISHLCEGAYDINDVFIQGNSTLMGMRIENAYFANGSFLIETTGARFEYVNGALKLYQGLDAKKRRLLAEIDFENEPNFINVESNEDHILFWSEYMKMGIYGDSTCIIAPTTRMTVQCKGNFRPDYRGRYKNSGELLLIDEFGGMEIYPQRHDAGYEIRRVELDRKDWIAEYVLNRDERVMLAVFPGKRFDWSKSFGLHFVVTTGQGNPNVYPFGQMPPASTIRRWSTKLDILAIQHNGLWESAGPYGPYIVGNPSELKRLIYTAHEYGMKVVLHCSLFYFLSRHNDPEAFYNQVKAVHEQYGTDGVYIDGLSVDAAGRKLDNKLLNWEMIRRLRQLFGEDGVIVYHGTSLGTPVATIPNIDSYCDATLYGESVKIKSANDPYLRYQVRKYGISNTVGFWDRYPKRPMGMTEKDVIDILLEMNCREWWNGYAFNREFGSQFEYYERRLDGLKQKYYSGKLEQ